MGIAMQIMSNDKTVRSNTVQDIKDFNSKSSATQAKKKRTISFYDACFLKGFWFYGWWHIWNIYKKRIFEE